MSQSSHKIAIDAKDQTAGAFDSIASRARVTGSQIKKMVGGALIGAGAYLGLNKIGDGVDELGKLSDVAQKAGVNVDELTKAATAFSVVGIQNMGVDEIGKAFAMMGKNNGRTGLGGFFQTIEEIGKIEDLSERSKKAMEVFGRSGLEFMPLINAAKSGTEAIREVVNAMPGVSQAAANAGDAMADAKKIGAEAFHSIWLNAIGKVCELFGVNIRNSAVSMAAYMDFGARVAWRYLKAFFDSNDEGAKRFKLVWESVKDAVIRSVVIMSATCFEYMKTIPERFIAGVAGGIMSVPSMFSARLREKHHEIMSSWLGEISTDMWSKIDKDLKSFGITLRESLGDEIKDIFSDVDTSDLEKKLKELLIKVPTVTTNVLGSTAGSGGNGSGGGNGGNGNGKIDGLSNIEMRKPDIRNDLILAGSNESRKLQILGPQLMSEQKKTNEILTKIKDKLDDVEGNQEKDLSSHVIMD